MLHTVAKEFQILSYFFCSHCAVSLATLESAVKQCGSAMRVRLEEELVLV